MYNRRIFTADPDYFPVRRMREIVDYLHEHDQHYSTPCAHRIVFEALLTLI